MDSLKVMNILGISKDYYHQLTEYINKLTEEFSEQYLGFLNSGDPLISISIYSFYPLMFQEYLRLEKKDLLKLIKFSHIHFISLFLLDKIYDDQKFHEPLELQVLLDMYHDNRKRIDNYISKFPETKTSIEYFYNDTKKGLFEEKYLYSNETILALEEIEEYCFTKYSYAKIAFLVFCEHGGTIQEKVKDKFLTSHDYFSVARQILDDLDDFQDDYNNNSFNIYLSYYQRKYGRRGEVKYCDEVVMELMDLSLSYFKKSIDIIDEYTNSGWYRYVLFYLDEAIKKRKCK